MLLKWLVALSSSSFTYIDRMYFFDNLSNRSIKTSCC